ncbi:Sec-independent protein translocase protein TatB [Methylobacterium pseudosasicola]|uniref:Sec-independent protein translocase protein TatB n=1 Tax=Methylobacterium pseudosasicola TaxID=582667 RepID=A0A1I4L3P8_9HYPH|nr:Sec-independent protein translocase protein TatB [Methylobacterium pseudosasicola]SFL85594.1 sec-independent protein translocase protein TatB [Methylobacterium pseudosasicola]
MLDMSWGEVMLIGGVALIVIGPKDLPKALRTVGQITTKLRRMAGEFQMQFNEAIREAELDEVRKEVDGIRNTVRSTSTGFNPVQTIRDELKGAVEGRVAARQGSETLGPEKPAADTRSLADATAQLKAEQDATAPTGTETAPIESAAHADPLQHAPPPEAPLPIPGSVDDPYGPPPDPPATHDTPMDPKNGATAR